jgi:hypothetical protein
MTVERVKSAVGAGIHPKGRRQSEEYRGTREQEHGGEFAKRYHEEIAGMSPEERAHYQAEYERTGVIKPRKK